MSSKPSLAEIQLQNQIKEQKKLDIYLAEVQEYFEIISEEDENENLEREQMWIERIRKGEGLSDFRQNSNGKEIHFMGNYDIRPPKCSLPLTQDHIDEFTYCAYHPIYTISNYFKIVNMDQGIVFFKLYDYQKELVRKFFHDNRILTLQARQSGKTSVIAACLLFYAIFNKNKAIGIIANKKAAANEVLDRIKLMYVNLPMWLKPGVMKWNEGRIEFENGCKIITSATTAASIRGQSLAVLYIDELSFIPKKMWDAFYKSTFPVISASKLAKIVCSTTPNGKDHFYYMWQDAIAKRSSFVTHLVRWYDVPGRDEEWKKRALSELGNSEEAFRQEYLCEFLGASIEYISLRKLEQIETILARPVYEDSSLKFRIFEQPQLHHDYVISIDVSEGRGLDYQAFVVIDITQMPFRVVATLKNNKIDVIHYANIIYQTALKYNDAYLIIENNFSDVAKDIWFNMEYTNIINMNLGKPENRPGKYFEIGVRTTTKTRRIGEEYLKHLVENDKIILNDKRIVDEFNNFEFNEVKKRFEPRDESINDDLFSALKSFSYVAKTMFFESLLKSGHRLNVFGRTPESEAEDSAALSFIIKPKVVETDTNPEKKKIHKDRVERRLWV